MNKQIKHDQPFTLDMNFAEAMNRFAKVNTKDLLTEENIEQTKQATPFIKWVGGKRGIIDELKERLPKHFNNYYEAFLGGGALFFELSKNLKKAFLSDMNFDLVVAYNVIKKDPDKLIAILEKYSELHSEDFYYKLRSKHDLQDPFEIASRFIYLNKTCFNGLFRVNKKGEFNTPMGKYSNPGICQEENIRACHKALKHATIEYRDFTTISPEKGDLCYFDPPYHPTDENSFTAYAKGDFSEKDQRDLATFCTDLHKKGVYVMVSNNNTKFIRDLFKSNIFKKGIVNAPRLVNCKPNGRNSVEELLITNY